MEGKSCSLEQKVGQLLRFLLGLSIRQASVWQSGVRQSWRVMRYVDVKRLERRTRGEGPPLFLSEIPEADRYLLRAYSKTVIGGDITADRTANQSAGDSVELSLGPGFFVHNLLGFRFHQYLFGDNRSLYRACTNLTNRRRPRVLLSSSPCHFWTWCLSIQLVPADACRPRREGAGGLMLWGGFRCRLCWTCHKRKDLAFAFDLVLG